MISILLDFLSRAFFSPKGNSRSRGSIAGEKRPSSADDEGTKTASQSSMDKRPVTSASESPVFKSKSKRRRVMIESDEEEESGGCDDVKSEDGDDVRGEEDGSEEVPENGESASDREAEEKNESDEVIRTSIVQFIFKVEVLLYM